MSPLPYLPDGQQELPARRIVLFANAQNRVMRIDESRLNEDGAGFEGQLITPSLCRADPSILWTLKEVQVWYTASQDSTFLMAVSLDGGDAFVDEYTIDVSGGTDAVLSVVQVPFNHTGDDIRLRFTLTNSIVKLYGYRPKLHPRGEIRYDVG